jgi:spermidine/putrescine transport system substrate-binding protein
LEPLNKEKIPNSKKLVKNLLKKSYDPENTHSLPFSWTTTGIAIQRDLYKGKISSWKEFFENPDLKGKVAVLDDSRESLAAIHKIFASSVNTTKADELRKAKEYFLKNRSQIKMFASDTVEILKNKEVFAAQSYSSDALQARRATNSKVEFIFPKEGGTIAIDNFVIFKSSKNKENAHRLINYMLETERNKNLVESQMIGPVVEDVKKQLSPSLQKDAALFPDPANLEKLEELIDLSDNNKLIEDIWMEIKNQ